MLLKFAVRAFTLQPTSSASFRKSWYADQEAMLVGQSIISSQAFNTDGVTFLLDGGSIEEMTLRNVRIIFHKQSNTDAQCGFR
jgi:hypothetical protein